MTIELSAVPIAGAIVTAIVAAIAWAFRKISNANEQLLVQAKVLEQHSKALEALLPRVAKLETDIVAVEARAEERMKSIHEHGKRLTDIYEQLGELKQDMTRALTLLEEKK